ncbi:MAG: hypothetical protein ABIP90_00310 [Vicinamibacterales bacterium]
MNPQTGSEEHESKIDWLGLVRVHGRFVLSIAISVVALVAVFGGVYLKWGQATRTVASLEFRPAFASLAALEYPNGLAFSPNDVTAGPIIDMVYDANNLSGVCDREAFRAGFFVEQRSDQSIFLDLEYQARLSEPRITMVERKILQEEHSTKRRGLPVQYRLVFVAPAACASLPSVVISKALVDVLSTWASESESKRGVMDVQVEVLTPATLDATVEGSGGLLLKADLLRNALQRIVQNISKVSKLPGAAVIRLGKEKLTFAEVQGKLIDLVGSRLDPLVMTSGRSMVKESAIWAAETVAAADLKQKAAEQRIKYYQDSLQEYSGLPGPVETGTGRPASSAPASTGNAAQSLVPLDDSFIRKIAELSESNVRYRQKLTDGMVDAQLAAVYEAERASYYRRLLQSLGGPVSEGESQDLSERLNAIVEEGKRLTRQFGDLYDEFSRVSLRAGSMYETRKPVTIETSQQFARRSLVNLILIAFVGTVVASFAFFAIRGRFNAEPR